MKRSFEVTRIDLVKSSMIKLVAFHNDTTFVQFTNDTVYSYAGTKEEDYEALVKAKSVGVHLNSAIKGNFEYEKVDYDLIVKEMPDSELVEFIGDCFKIHTNYEDLTTEDIIYKIKKATGSNNSELITSEVKKYKSFQK